MERMRGSDAAMCQRAASMPPHWACISSTKSHLEFLPAVSGVQQKAGHNQEHLVGGGQNTLGSRWVRRLQDIPKYAAVQQS